MVVQELQQLGVLQGAVDDQHILGQMCSQCSTALAETASLTIELLNSFLHSIRQIQTSLFGP